MFRHLEIRIRGQIGRWLEKLCRVILPRRPPIYLGNNLAIAHLYTGERIIVDTRDMSVAIHLLEFGIWEKNVTRVFFSLLKPQDVFFDLGANCGYFTVLAASRMKRAAGRVYSFEPNPALSKVIDLSAMVNGWSETVTVENLAVGDQRETLTLHLLDNLLGSSSLRELPGTSNTRQVECVDLDSYTREKEIARIDLIKLDVEGFEDRVYRGMKEVVRQNDTLKILMEFSPDRYQDAEGFFQQVCDDFPYRYSITRRGSLAKIADYASLMRFCAENLVELVLSKSPL